MSEESELRRLANGPMSEGVVAWIGLRPATKVSMRCVAEVRASEGGGLDGDRYRPKTTGARGVTLVMAEHVEAIGAIMGANVDFATLRRNIVTSGINLASLRGSRFTVGEAEMEWTGECDPCGRMEKALGPGGFNAMVGHGGITARVVRTGIVSLASRVCRIKA